MMDVYLSRTVFAILLAYVSGFNVVYDTRANGATSAQMFGLSMLSCMRACKCSEGCTLANYHRLTRLCEFFDGSADGDLTPSPGFVVIELSDDFKEALRADRRFSCVDFKKACPHNATYPNPDLLGNSNVAGTKRVLRCQRMQISEGMRTSTCDSEAGWSDTGTCVSMTSTVVPIVTSAATTTVTSTQDPCQSYTIPLGSGSGGKVTSMRDSCTSNSDCIDAESECSNGKCGCKPGRSYYPLCHACVEICPGEYGDTFQFWDGYYIKDNNKLVQEVSSIEACKNLCLRYKPDGYTCRYADVGPTMPGKCYLGEVPDDKGPPLVYQAGSGGFLQRDCAN